MKDMTITGNAIENLLDSYADHKAMMKTYEDEVDFDVDKLENDAEYMYHRGFCESSKQWMKCLGISPDSPIIEIMVREHMK